MALVLVLTLVTLLEPSPVLLPQSGPSSVERGDQAHRAPVQVVWTRQPSLLDEAQLPGYQPEVAAEPVERIETLQQSLPEPMPIPAMAPDPVYRGRLLRGGEHYVFLDNGDGVHAYKQGDSIDEKWRLTRIDEQQVQLRDRQSGVTRQIPMVRADQPLSNDAGGHVLPVSQNLPIQ
ncbi:hypothetical protein [Pseudomonas sp. microsymbiont 2]